MTLKQLATASVIALSIIGRHCVEFIRDITEANKEADKMWKIARSVKNYPSRKPSWEEQE